MTNTIEQVIMTDPIDALPGDEPILKEQIVYETWRYAWARAVARAWADSSFEQRLLSPDGANEVLAELGWKAPNGLTIRVKAVDNPDYHYEASPTQNGWANIDKTLGWEVIARYPPRPKNQAVLALALADYQATGLTYPFTTS